MSDKRQTTVCLEGWYYLVVMAFVVTAALIREINLLMVLFGLMLGALFFSWRLAGGMLQRLEVRRRLPLLAGAGETVTVELELRNLRSRLPSWALVVEDRVELAQGGAAVPPISASLLFAHVAPKQQRLQAYQGKFAQRGLYRFGPLRVSTRFPLGLIRRIWVVERPDSLVVHPRLGRLTARWESRRHEAADGLARQQRPMGMTEGDYHGLREWRAGDSRRWIHWRSSARRGELIVRQFEQDRSRDLVLVVELWQPAKPTAQQRRRAEEILSFAATLVHDRCRSGGSRLVLAIAGQSPCVVSGMCSPALLRESLEGLAMAQATTTDALPAAVDRACTAATHQAEVVLVSTRAMDVADTLRFQTIWSDPRKQAMLTQALLVTTEGEGLSPWFEPGAES